MSSQGIFFYSCVRNNRENIISTFINFNGISMKKSRIHG